MAIGPETKQLYHNFKSINSSKLKPSQILLLQQSESARDDVLSTLIIENESFPVCMPESPQIIQLCRFRDWFRQSLQLLWTFNQSSSKNKQNKQNKIKLRKDIKRQILKGEQISQLANTSIINAHVPIVVDMLNQLIQKPSTKGSTGYDIFDLEFEKLLSPSVKPSKIITIPISKEEIIDQNLLRELPMHQSSHQVASADNDVELQELSQLNFLSSTRGHQITQKEQQSHN